MTVKPSGFAGGLSSCYKGASMCKVLNKHHAGIPAVAIYIGRGSKWGNPFVLNRNGDRMAVIEKHERWLADQRSLLRTIDELKGRDLICFCAPAGCHGDILLRLANASRDERIAWWRSMKVRYSMERRLSLMPRHRPSAPGIHACGFGWPPARFARRGRYRWRGVMTSHCTNHPNPSTTASFPAARPSREGDVRPW